MGKNVEQDASMKRLVPACSRHAWTTLKFREILSSEVLNVQGIQNAENGRTRLHA